MLSFAGLQPSCAADVSSLHGTQLLAYEVDLAAAGYRFSA